MERVFRRFESFEQQEKQQIADFVSLTPEQRQEIAKALRERYYGRHTVDVREFHKKQGSRAEE